MTGPRRQPRARPGRTDPASRDPAGGDPLARAHDRLTAAVDALVDGRAWRAMLEVAARFPRYSPNNVLLISVQRPDATTVAGLRTWNRLGRRVRQGEKGIAILAPCTYRADPTPGSGTPAEATAPREAGDPAGAGRPVLRGFRVVHVFDLTQTEGAPLPDVAPAPLTGDAPAWLWDRLARVVEADGYRVERGACGAAYGHTRFAEKVVRVRDDVEDPQATKTLAHELAHIRAEHHTRFAATYHRDPRCRGIAEVEAESIAYVVTGAAGLDTAGYTVPYVAHWAGGDTALLRDTAARVITTARGILTDAGALPADPTHTAQSPWRTPATIGGTAATATIAAPGQGGPAR